MGVSKVDFAGKTLVDLTSDTVNEQSLLSGYTAHNRAGELIEGLAVIPTKLSQLENDAGYAKTESPEFTGIPTAPTPPDNTNSTQIATTAYVKTLIANLVNGAPETLDTLKEIADALGENDDAVQALNAAIGNKVDKVADKGLSTNDFTTAEKNKLAGIANNANNYSLPLASSTVRGGVKVGYAENGKNYPVELSNEQMFVNVPWTDNNTWKANTASSEGYVAKGSGQANKVWKTDANGVPGWRSDANTTYANMAGATASAAGKSGLVPAPAAGKQNSFLRGDGTFVGTSTSLAGTVSGVPADQTAVKALNDKFGGCTLEQVGQDFYITGADAVRKKLGEFAAATENYGATFASISGPMYVVDSVKTIVQDECLFVSHDKSQTKFNGGFSGIVNDDIYISGCALNKMSAQCYIIVKILNDGIYKIKFKSYGGTSLDECVYLNKGNEIEFRGFAYIYSDSLAEIYRLE